MNLNSQGRRSSFLKISLSLELSDPADIPRIESVLPRIVDAFQTYLRELRPEDLRGSAGLYRLRRGCLPASIGQPLSVEAETLPGLVEQGRVFGVPIEGAFIDIGVPADYAAFCARHG